MPGTLSRDSKVARFDLRATPARAEADVFDELDGDHYLFVRNTRSRKFVVLLSQGNSTAVARVIPADRPLESPLALSAKRPGFKYEIDHYGSSFYFLGNPSGPDRAVFRASESRPGVDAWQAIPNPVMSDVESMLIFDSHLVVTGLKDAFVKAATIRLADGKVTEVKLQNRFGAIAPGNNVDPKAGKYVFTFSSYTAPAALQELDLATAKVRTIKQAAYPGHDPSRFEVRRIWTRASDGTRIPANLVSKRGLKKDGKNPLLVWAYGNYGTSTIDGWVLGMDRLSLLDRGVVYGGRLSARRRRDGRQVGEDGEMFKKRNTFTDLIVVAEQLVTTATPRASASLCRA